MDSQSVVNTLSSITVGQIIAWASVIVAIITAICTGTIKLYKVFTKYREAKEKNEKQESIIESHEGTLKEIDNTLLEIKKSLEEQKVVNLKQVRHTIVHTCEDALDRGEISINKLRSLEEMYEEYIDIFHGNGYVKTLVEKVRQLKVVGKTDD